MKISCRNIPLLISRSLDGDCGSEDLIALEAHIAGCGKCRCTAKRFAAHAALIEDSFSDAPLPVSAVRALGRPDARLRMPLSIPGPGWGFAGAAAVVIVLIILLAGGRGNGSGGGLPAVVIESPNPSTMSFPLSSIIYYETYAGETVHSQFVRISPEQTVPVPSTVRERLAESAYNSPLFTDAIVAVSAVFQGSEQ